MLKSAVGGLESLFDKRGKTTPNPSLIRHKDGGEGNYISPLRRLCGGLRGRPRGGLIFIHIIPNFNRTVII